MRIKELFRLSLVSIFLAILGGVVFPIRAYAVSFTFTAAGDYDWDTSTTVPVMNAIKNTNPNFHVAVGDFRYSSSGSPGGWATNVKNIVGNIPFEIVSGNHDASSIDEYIPALPDKIGGIQGQYGKEYYFDYPTSGPIARFIFTAPNEIYSYSANAAHYNWAVSAIDDARNKGIKWIFVNHHKNCITAGVKSCEVGSDFFNMLISKKVDVIIQGHEHGYERSKQLKCVKVGSYDSTCVVGTGNSLTKGAGTVILVIGTGGNNLRAMNTGDSEYPYFATVNDTAYGIGKFVVSDTQLSYNFIRAAGGSYSDAMTITGSGIPPTNGPSPTGGNPSPTISIPPGTTALALTISLHGIGNGGDNQNPNGGGNNAPVRSSRVVTVTLTDKNNVDLAPKQGVITYNPSAGNYRGTVALDSSVVTGAYLVKVKVDNFLTRLYPGIQTLTKGQSNTLPSIFLINGDSNGDNRLSVLDYNMILDCFSDLTPAKNCPDFAKKLATDLTDDGSVNQFDYNLFLRELSVQSGQ